MIYRIIYALCIELVPRHCDPPNISRALTVRLRSDGTHQGRNGRPRPSKLRAADLRVGDQLLCMCRWATITDIKAESENYIDDARGVQHQGDGYPYPWAGETRSVEKLRLANREVSKIR